VVVYPVLQIVILPVDLALNIFRGNNPSFTDERFNILPDARQGFFRITLVNFDKKRGVGNVEKKRLPVF